MKTPPEPIPDNELHMIDVCQQIGRVAGSNCHFTDGLARKLAALEKPIEALTVAELVAAIDEHRAAYNDTKSNNP